MSEVQACAAVDARSPSSPATACKQDVAAAASSCTGRPYGYGAVFPCFSPRSSGAGDTIDWTMAEEKILRDVASWLSPADLRRARLVCQSWCGSLATLTTKAATPPEATVAQWKGQLEALAAAFPCLHELTVNSRLSAMAAQQLGALSAAKQLHVLNIPHGQALQDRSLLALQPLAPHLRELRINGAASLSRRALLLLSVLANLEVLELKNCGKISWLELQQAWRAACVAHEAQAAADAARATNANGGSSGGGSSGSSGSGGASAGSSSGGGGGGSLLSSKLGSWLPSGRLFRTSSPSSSAIQTALASQRSGGTGGAGNLLSKVQEFARSTSGAAALAVAQLGIVGAVGNGRSSCGGNTHEVTPARSLLHRKQKLGAAASFSAYEDAVGRLAVCKEEDGAASTDATSSGRAAALAGCFPVRGGPLLRLRTRSAMLSRAVDDAGSPRPASVLTRVGSLMWHSSAAAAAAAAAAAGSECNSSSSSGGSGSSSSHQHHPSLEAQTSSVQAALLAYLAQEEEEAAAGQEELDMPAVSASGAPLSVQPARNGSGSSSRAVAAGSGVRVVAGSSGSSSQPSGAAGHASATATTSSGASSSSQLPGAAGAPQAGSTQAPQPSQQRYTPRRRTTGDKGLPAMPFTKLRSLSLSCSEVTLKSAGQELAAVAAISSLTALEISKCKLPDAVFAQLRGLQRLAKLKLSGLWSMGDAGLFEIAQLTTLHSLALSEAMHITAGGLQALTSLSQLTSLAMGLTQDVGQGSLGHVAVALPQLQCLEAATPSWGDLDCELLAQRAGGGGQHEQQQQQLGGSEPMLWDVAAMLTGGSFTRSAGGSGSSISSRAPSKLLSGLAPHSSTSSRSSSSLDLRPPSFSASFGSFSMPAAAASSGRRASLLARGAGASQQQQPKQQQQQQLLVLRLHGSRGLTTRGLAALKQLPELHTLLLDGCKEVPAAEFVSQGLLPPKLASLGLRRLPFGNLFSGCVSAPACGAHLTRLELAALEAVHDGQLRRLLSFFPRVEHLSLAGCADLGDGVVPHLPALARLRHLNLAGTGVTGASFEHLCRLPELQALVLKGCGRLQDAGLAALLDARTLEVLDVSECGGVSSEGLAAVMAALPQLARLDVSGCRGVGRALLDACPHCLHLQHSLPAP